MPIPFMALAGLAASALSSMGSKGGEGGGGVAGFAPAQQIQPFRAADPSVNPQQMPGMMQMRKPLQMMGGGMPYG